MRLPRLSLTIKTKTFLQPKNHVCPVCYKAYCYEKPFCKHVALCNHEDQQPLLKRKSKKQNLVQALLIYLSLFSFVQCIFICNSPPVFKARHFPSLRFVL